MKRSVSIVRAAAFILLGSVLFAGCRRAPISSPVEDAPRVRVIGQRGGNLRYRISAPPQTFNYLLAADESSLIVAFYLLGGRLAEFDHEKQAYIAGLAETWHLADDGRTLDLSLRNGLKFSDGSPLTSEDVAFTFRALYDERTASLAFRDAMVIEGKPIEVKVLDPLRLQLVFPSPVAAPEGYLSNLAVLPRQALEASFNAGKLRESYALTSSPASIVTAGPFSVRASTPGENVTFARNRHYWKKDSAGNQLPYLDELIVEVASDASNAIARLRNGSLDIYDRLRPADYAALLVDRGDVRALDLGPGLYTDHLWFNLNQTTRAGKPVVDPGKRALFSDVRFRRAVALSIDRETIAKINLRGLATPLNGFVSPGNRAWVADLPPLKRDPSQAQALLKEMGCTLGAEGAPPPLICHGRPVEFTLILPVESQPRVEMASVIQADLAKLGIKMQVAPLEAGELARRLNETYEYDAALFGTSVTEPDPSSYANFLTSSSPSHQWAPRQARPATEWEARVDHLVAEQARSRDPERRRAIFREIQLVLAEQMPVIPLVARHLTSGGRRRIGNHRPSTLLPYSLWNAEELFIRQ
jgi:peptide/nickel transport system substrate-binding protein